VPAVYPVTPILAEASGIADSKINPGYLWVEEDSGNPPLVTLLGHQGKVLKTIYLKGAINRDWEDIALAGGPVAGKNYLYLAETGDNHAVYPSAAFYRFEEPSAATDTITNYDIINFTYPDGPHDAEAFLVDDATKDIFVLTKRDALSRVYRIAYPYSATAMNQAVAAGSLPYNGVTGATQNADGTGIIVRTYAQLLYYTRLPGETIAQALQKTFTALAYQPEPQGEAVTFAVNGSGFFTLSEKGLSPSQFLYFYGKQ
jgi:hypothetical protein